ncbi:hypothetical protein C8Q80DRAFT_731073 [Daedaleopsis nitida]|nr:hypothetical protein C8Q80DRAFT_731073 [Daedaleopsis nitida]
MTGRAGRPPNPHIDSGAPSWLNHLRSSLQAPLQAVIYTALLVALGLFSVSQAFALSAHERLCRFLGLSPCQVHGPRESAIVIVGGDDDLGRHLALNFSQQGYTVFALCPDRQPAVQSAPGDASNVSSLIQEWHQRIKRSGESTSPWGLVAPIVLDMTSGAQRTRAFETVDAYCATHCLHLVAVIVLPAPSFITSKPARAGLSISAWGDLVRGCLVEPISVVEDYAGLLSATSGRVVLLLASGHHQWIPPLHRDVLRSVARHLREELTASGTRISLVTAGPSAPVSKAPDLTGSETG